MPWHEGLLQPRKGAMTDSPGSTTATDEDVRLLTPKEVAELTQISRTNVYALIASGEIPSMRFGKRDIRVPRAGLRRYIEDRCTVAE